MRRLQPEVHHQLSDFAHRNANLSYRVDSTAKTACRMQLPLQIRFANGDQWLGEKIRSASMRTLYQIYSSGTATEEHQYGVGFITEKSMQSYVSNFTPTSERGALLQMNTSPAPANIIRICAPTADKSEEERRKLL